MNQKSSWFQRSQTSKQLKNVEAVIRIVTSQLVSGVKMKKLMGRKPILCQKRLNYSSSIVCRGGIKSKDEL